MSERQLLDWAMQIAAAEEMARARIVFKPEVKIAPTPPLRTIIGSEKDLAIPAEIIDEEGSGQLKELLIRSGFKEWSLAAFADGQQLYNHPYEWFMGISQELEEVDAFQAEDGTYVLRLSDIKFAESLKVKAGPLVVTLAGEKPRLKEIFWKLELAGQ